MNTISPINIIRAIRKRKDARKPIFHDSILMETLYFFAAAACFLAALAMLQTLLDAY